MVDLQLVEMSYTVKRNMQVGSIAGVRGRALISYHMLELMFGSAGSEEKGEVQQNSTDDAQWRLVPRFSSFLTFSPSLWNSLACFHHIVCFDTSVVPDPEHKAIPCFNVLSSKNVFCNLHFLLWAELCFLCFDQAEADWPHQLQKKKKKRLGKVSDTQIGLTFWQCCGFIWTHWYDAINLSFKGFFEPILYLFFYIIKVKIHQLACALTAPPQDTLIPQNERVKM